MDPEMLIIAPTAHFFTIPPPLSTSRDRRRASGEALSHCRLELTTGGDLRMSTSKIQQHFYVFGANTAPVHLKQHHDATGLISMSTY